MVFAIPVLLRKLAVFIGTGTFLTFLFLSCSGNTGEAPQSRLVGVTLQRMGLLVSALEQTDDSTHTLGVEEIRTRGNAEWREQKKAYPTFGYTTDAHWFRLSLINSTERPMQIVTRVAFEHIDRIELHAYQEGVKYYETFSGREYPFAIRDIPHRRFAFSFDLPPGKSTLFLMARSRHTLNVPIQFLSHAEYQSEWVREQIRMGMYFGIIAFLFFLNLLFFYAFRDDHFLVYLFYVLAGAMFQVALQGYGFKYLWPDAPEWNAVSLTILGALFGASVLVFCKRFLGTALHLPVTNTIFNVLISAWVLIVLSLFVLPLGRTESLVNFMFLPLIILCMTAGVKMQRRGNRAARYYLIGWTLYFFLGIVYLIQNLGLIPNGFFYGVDMYEFMLLGSMCEMVFFPVAISDRIRTIVQEQRERGEAPATTARQSRLTRLDLEALRKRLYDLMSERQVYRQNITLGKLARFVGIPEKDLSEFLNEAERKSFYQFVNEFRIREACKLLLNKPDLKILEVAYSVGFQSLSTFNSAFQKQQGMSPREFRKTQREA